MHLFCRVGTQWRVGMGGATGLDYGAVYPLMNSMNLTPTDWDGLLSSVQTLENAALKAMNTKE